MGVQVVTMLKKSPKIFYTFRNKEYCLSRIGQIFSVFCLESEPETAKEEMEYLKFDFSRISSKYDNQDLLLLYDLNQDDSYTEWEMPGLKGSYKHTAQDYAERLKQTDILNLL